jgi:RNA recognition motif-containing protein
MVRTPTVEVWHVFAPTNGKDLPASPSRQDQQGEDMSTKLYVGNLSYEMTETQLQTLFSEAGEVTSAKIITDRETR